MDISLLGLKVSIKDEQLEQVVAIILRVPGLFILDYSWQFLLYNALPQSLEWPDIITSLLTASVILQGVLLLLLPLEELVNLYMHYISVALLAAAEFFSRHYVLVEQAEALSVSKIEIEKQSFLFTDTDNIVYLKRQISSIAFHIIIATTISYLLDIECNMRKSFLAIYSVPVAARMANFPIVHLHVIHNFCSAFMILSMIYYMISFVPKLITYMKDVYERMIVTIDAFGFVHALVFIWKKFFISSQFLLFWAVLLTTQLYNYTYHPQEYSSTIERSLSYPVTEEWYLLLLYAISEICASPISLLGTCFAVSYFSYGVLSLTKLFIQGYNGIITDQLVHAGMGEGLTMVLLAIQTGLIDLKMPHRLGAMSIILFIVIGSLIQSMYEITEPVLLALSASHSRSIFRHLRVLSVCIFLFVFPLYMTYMLYYVFDIDFWTLVVISTCALTSVQVLGMLVVYVLFLYDAYCEECWDGLDDVVYYAKAVTRVLEFLVAVFVVGAGMRESVQGDWSLVNSSVLIIHCYYNVWQRLQSGWKSFLLRREAVRKINSLPEASSKDLKLYNDVCAICYMEMKVARITSCKHFFHGSCLRKWLYVQDKCPMCSAKICLGQDTDSPETTETPVAETEVINPVGTDDSSTHRDSG